MSRRARILLALGALALLARVGFAVRFPRAAPDGGVLDVDQYHSIGARFLEHRALLNDRGEPTAHREPLYPLVLAALYSATGVKYWAVVALNVLFGIGTVLLLYKAGEGLFGERVAALAAGMAAVYPQMLFYVTEARRETLQTLLLLGAVTAALGAYRRDCLRSAAVAGGLGALVGLTNSALLPAAAVLAPALWGLGRRAGKPLLKPALAMVVAMSGVYSLWPIRNLVVFHRFIPGITHGGDHLYLGFLIPNDVAGTPEAERIVREDPVVRRIDQLPEDERGPAYYRATREWIAAHPGGFVQRVVQSFLKLWRLYPYARDYGMNYRLIFWTAILSDGWMIPLGVLGLVLALRRESAAWLPAAALAAASAVYSVFWSIIRYRLPLMPLLLLFTAYALEVGWEGAKKIRNSRA